MAANSRESRRRKILERGPDRLSLITGRIRPPSSQLPRDPSTDSSQPLLSIHHQPLLSTTVSPDVEDKSKSDASGSLLPKQDPVIDSGLIGADDTGSSIEPPFILSETGIEDTRASAFEVNGTVQASLISLTDQNSSVSTSSVEQNLEPLQTYQYRFFTPSQIKSAIAATQITRLFCSVAASVLVVLSCLGFPLLGSNNFVKSIVSFRPLYLVLLTNVTVVVWRLLSDNQGGFRRAIRGGIKIPSNDASDWAEQASKLLEVGLVMQKVIDAVFMDCSVYSLIIVCGLSIASSVS
ncbi:hypothetical protein Ddye_007688 [Dipteronia dyeriana]|uniref:Uncharacterized protein n=1 Tax=Dipteronia dyeriana TaxID=168575 RepID=A0AAD9XKI0_9ROSI|nr:hypothetical protein Ddye_007688 [Dipteronia dyeriana]